MKKTFRELDENVARCVRTRRAIERECKTFEGLCDFLEQLEREDDAPAGKRKSTSSTVRAKKTASAPTHSRAGNTMRSRASKPTSK